MLRKIITKIVSMGILKELSLSGLTIFVRTDAAVMARLHEELFLRLVANDVRFSHCRTPFLLLWYTGLCL